MEKMVTQWQSKIDLSKAELSERDQESQEKIDRLE